MVIKDIVQAGNSLLRKKAKPVKACFSQEIKQTIVDLIDTMNYSHLVGIAAPQIGKSLRIFISEIKKTKYRTDSEASALTVYINPKITGMSVKKATDYEGCGSVAYSKLFGPVERYNWVTVEAQNEKGKNFQVKANGLLARIIQHEYDHLEGMLFTDKLTDWSEIMSSEEYIKMRARQNIKSSAQK
jgi:peptide deformylase